MQGWTARWRETITEDSFDRLAPPNSMSADKWNDNSEVAFLSNGPEGWKSESAQIVAVTHHTRGFHQVKDELSSVRLLHITESQEMTRCPHQQEGGKAERTAEGACVLLRLIPRSDACRLFCVYRRSSSLCCPWAGITVGSYDGCPALRMGV